MLIISFAECFNCLSVKVSQLALRYNFFCLDEELTSLLQKTSFSATSRPYNRTNRNGFAGIITLEIRLLIVFLRSACREISFILKKPLC
jgi:hypothetical protein